MPFTVLAAFIKSEDTLVPVLLPLLSIAQLVPGTKFKFVALTKFGNTLIELASLLFTLVLYAAKV